MSKKLYPETDIQNIANAIRALNGSTDTYTVSEMASVIVLPENAYYLKESARANPLSITDGEELKCQSAVVTFTPKQSGSGDPSPENVRPISGWDSVGLTRTGNNVLNALSSFQFLKQNYYGNNLVINETEKTANFNAVLSTGYYGLIQNTSPEYPTYYEFKENTSYTFIFKADGNTDYLNIAVSFTDGTNTDSFRKSNRDSDGYITYVSPSNKTVRSLYIGKYNGTSTFYYDTFCVMEGTHTRADFEPYNGETYTATFPSTVYGVEYEFVSGKCQNKWSDLIDISDFTWTYNSGSGGYFASSALSDKNYGIINTKCSMLKTSNSSSVSDMEDCSIKGATNSKVLYIKKSDCTTTEDLLSVLNGGKICYELDTAINVTTTPNTIELKQGTNTFSTDGNSVQVKYFSKSL